MFLERFKHFFGPKVCGELYAQLEEKYEQLEIEHCRQEIKVKAIYKNNAELIAQIGDWHSSYQRLKLTFSVAMTETPTFEDYETVMASKNIDIEQLEGLVHDLSFENSELKQSLEQAKLKAKSSEWCGELDENLCRYYSFKQISILKNQKAV